jgi:hypothetical protein
MLLVRSSNGDLNSVPTTQTPRRRNRWRGCLGVRHVFDIPAHIRDIEEAHREERPENHWGEHVYAIIVHTVFCAIALFSRDARVSRDECPCFTG